MPETRHKVKAVTWKHNHICDHCGTGNMIVDPPWDKYKQLGVWDHTCNQCGFQTKMTKIYPYINTEYVLDTEEEE